MDKQARKALEMARAWILTVAHRVEGHAVIEKIDAALSAPTEQVPVDDSMEDPVLVPRGLLGAACFAIDKKRDAPTILAKLRAITMSAASPSAPTAVQPAKLKRGTTGKCSRKTGCECDAEGLGDECVWLVPTTTPTAVKEAGGVPAFILLAEQVLSMDMVTEKGVRARELARQALKEHDGYRTTLELVAHATAPGHDDGGYHEAAHDLATQARAVQPTTPVVGWTLEALTDDQIDAALDAWFLAVADFRTRMRKAFEAAIAAKNNMTLGGE